MTVPDSTTPAHTPGPWHVETSTDSFGWRNYAINSGRQDGCHAANARLIAAAPDLLAALKLLLEEEHRDDDDPLLIRAREKACFALQKAEGR